MRLRLVEMCREVEMHGQDYRQSSVCDHQVSAPQRGKGSDARERCALTLKAGQGMVETEIRTLDSLAGMPVFKTGDINHSAISRTILSLCGFARRFPTTETKHRRACIICSPAIVFQRRTFTCAAAKAKAFPKWWCVRRQANFPVNDNQNSRLSLALSSSGSAVDVGWTGA